MNTAAIRALLLAAAIAAPFSTAQATGRLTCETVAPDKWLTEDALTKKLTADGWLVRFMKKDGGCWEVYGTTPEGQRVEAYFHPATGEKLLVGQRGKILFRAGEK
tara:strand:+ start:1169 stop:1483 length:315 start_codon:yes stop_codon:yes gene_type:complete